MKEKNIKALKIAMWTSVVFGILFIISQICFFFMKINIHASESFISIGVMFLIVGNSIWAVLKDESK